MRLQSQIIKTILFPFIIGIFLSFLVIISVLYNYGYNYLDQKTQENIVEAQFNLTSIRIYSVCTLLYRSLQKSQLLLEQLTSSYIFYANETDLNIKGSDFNDCSNTQSECFVRNGKLSPGEIKKFRNDSNSNKTSIWFLSNKTVNYTSLSDANAKTQLTILSHMNLLLYSAQQTDINTINFIYFLFDSTNLVYGFPLSSQLNDGGLIEAFTLHKNPSWCKDELSQQTDAEKAPDYYIFKCKDWYLLLNQTANEYESRDFILLPPYFDLNDQKNIIFTQCMKFTDPVSTKRAFVCIDHKPNNLFDSFDKINNMMPGHFFITFVNISYNPFYYENLLYEPKNKPLSAFEFTEHDSFYLEELLYFNDEITKEMTRDYSEYISLSAESALGLFQNIDNDKHINYFTKDGKIYNFTIFPFLRYFNNTYINELNIIYVYQANELFNNMFSYQKTFQKRLNLVLILLIYVSLVLGLIVWCSLSFLAKYIVIPIKNVQYMLKGINIGGENRLHFLEALETKELIDKKQIQERLSIKNGLISSKETLNMNNTIKDEQQNLLMNQQLFSQEQGILKTTKKIFDSNPKNHTDNISSSQLAMNAGSDNQTTNIIGQQQDKLLNKDEEIFLEQCISSKTTLEKEIRFYNFDEGLLEYRPREINGLVNLLLDLKQALILTSNTHHNNNPKEKIIEYSTSQCTFENVKNKEGSYICQSNIGNLNFLCSYYDKAIYHLCLSLQIPYLKKFLSKTLNDELDVSDSLLHLIDSQYNKNFPNEITNQLVKQQQQRSSHQTYSQKSIVNLINTRYNKLIHIYFKFFSMLKKSKRKIDDLNGMYLHTQYTTIPHFHKVLIQYVYLCYVSNDLVKIGESILDYIEFLLKFKLSSIKNKKDIYNKHLSNIPYYKNMQDIKKNILNKISNWFDLYDHYVTHVSENTTLANDKSVIDLYNNNISSNSSTNNNEGLNSKNQVNEPYQNQSVFLFKIQIQRGNFLKGKFAYKCKDYTDAAHYFTQACSNCLLVYDGLIKRKALQNLNKIVLKLEKKITKNDYYPNKLTDNSNTNNYLNDIINIKNEIKTDLGRLHSKKAKDIIVIIDKGHIKETAELNAYIEEAKNILENYLTHNDRFGIFMFNKDCRLVCPLTYKKDIDVEMVWNYMQVYSTQKKLDNENNEDNNNDNSDESIELLKEGMSDDTFINSLNYCLNYLLIKMKEINDKYMIIFTNFLEHNANLEIIDRMKRERNVTYIIVSKYNESFNELSNVISFFDGCGKDSEFVDFNNMKEIKNILARNITINEIVFSNEIY